MNKDGTKTIQGLSDADDCLILIESVQKGILQNLCYKYLRLILKQLKAEVHHCEHWQH